VRLGVAALVLAPLAWARAGREIARLGRREWGLCLLSGALLAVHFWTWITSLEHTSVASSAALVTTNPIWVGLASAWFLRERPRAAALAGIGLTITGSLLIFAADAGGTGPGAGRDPSLGNLLALLGAFAASGYLLVGRALRAGISLLAYVWLAYSAAALILCAALFFSATPVRELAPAAWGFMVLLALGPQLLGHTAFNWALRKLSATFVAVAILGEPIGSALLAWLLFDERFTALQFAGFALLLAGIFVAARGEKSY
jgi:drug/metabolite transporter (DMT)-like permease